MPPSPLELAQLYSLAQAAARLAYAPYSGFRVGAALLFADGTTVTGCNVENASFGLTSCAERNAVFRAVSERGAAARIVAAAVANLNNAGSPPCGACRQVLSEFMADDAVIVFPASAGVTLATIAFRELLPYSFQIDGSR